jgi:hypothetical protein
MRLEEFFFFSFTVYKAMEFFRSCLRNADRCIAKGLLGIYVFFFFRFTYLNK